MSPEKIEINKYSLLKTIALLNNFIQNIIKKNAITDLNPAKNIGFKPEFTIFITTWFIPKSKENAIKADAPKKSIFVFFSIRASFFFINDLDVGRSFGY